MKRYLSVLTLPFVALFSPGVFADVDPVTVNGGTVNFTGTIVDAPCVVSVNAESQTVALGQYRTDSFTGTGSVSSPVDFKITLADCSSETYTSAAVTFSGGTVSGNNMALTLISNNDGSSVAENVGIQILQDSETLAVDGSTASEAKNISDGTNSLAFQARFIALDDTVTAGVANSSADFTITYM